MLLGGNRVSPLWQTPFLPLLYVWAAAFLGFAFVSATLLFCGVMWKRPLDIDILGEMSRINSWLIGTWLVFRIADLSIRGQIVAAFRPNVDAVLFWAEMALLAAAFWFQRNPAVRRSPRKMFYGALLATVGGMLYRFDPTTLSLIHISHRQGRLHGRREPHRRAAYRGWFGRRTGKARLQSVGSSCRHRNNSEAYGPDCTQ